MPAAAALCLAALLSAAPVPPPSPESPVAPSWFAASTCTALTLTKHRSLGDAAVVRQAELSDADAVKHLAGRVTELPPNGEKMKSFSSSASWLELTFQCGAQKHTVDVINGMVKTPSTGFNTDTREQEAALAADLNALLEPELNQRIPLVKGLPVQFKDFTLTHGGQTTSEKLEATVTLQRSLFTVKDKAGAEQKLEVLSGQLPPRPMPFTVNGKKLTLLTYQTKKGERLYPRFFMVTK